MKKYTKKVTNDVSKILETLQNIDPLPIKDGAGTLDIEKFNKLPEVIKVKKELESLNMGSRSNLIDAGFMAATLVLIFD